MRSKEKIIKNEEEIRIKLKKIAFKFENLQFS